MKYQIVHENGGVAEVELWPQQRAIYQELSAVREPYDRSPVFVAGHHQCGKTTAIVCWIADYIRDRKRHNPASFTTIRASAYEVRVLASFTQRLQCALRSSENFVEVNSTDYCVLALTDDDMSADIMYWIRPANLNVDLSPYARRRAVLTIVELDRPLHTASAAWWEDPNCVAGSADLGSEDTQFETGMLERHGVGVDMAHLQFRRKTLNTLFCGDADISIACIPHSAGKL